MTKTKLYKDRYFWKSGKGYRERKIASTFVATLSAADKYPILIAPCALKLQRVNVNALTYPHMSDDGNVTLTLYKADAGADTALTSGLQIQGDTDETAQDLTVSSSDVSEGELVYMDVAVTGTIGTNGDCVIFQVEYRHNEN